MTLFPFTRLRRALTTLVAALAVLCAPLLTTLRADAQQGAMVRLAGSLAPLAMSSPVVSGLDGATTLHLSFILPLRDPAGAQEFVTHVSALGDPLYGQYLTPAQFTGQFGPAPADYDTVVAYAQAEGMTIERTYDSRLRLDVAVSAANAEQIFEVHFQQRQSPRDGRLFYAADADPAVPAEIARVLTGINGLDGAFHPTSRLHRMPIRLVRDGLGLRPQGAAPQPRAGAPFPGQLTPAFIKKAYHYTGAYDGTGLTVGTIQYAGYSAADVQTFQDAFGLPHTVLENVSVDGSVYTDNDAEPLLDIDYLTGIASGVTKCIQYNGGSFAQNLDRIATDNVAKVISSSWGSDDKTVGGAELDSINSELVKLAAQGITFCDATGDHGPYTSGNKADGFTNDVFAVQPLCLGVGGSVLTYNQNTGDYLSETSWDDKDPDPTVAPWAGGGGISNHFGLPNYQAGLGTPQNLGSATFRMVPDVSMSAKNYQIYKDGAWEGIGGTSASSPSFAAFLTIINQARLSTGGVSLGFLNPTLYTLLHSSRYAADFHDVQDGSTNDYYPAVPGYDLTTGIGTPIVDSLLADLTTTTSDPQPLSGTVTNAQTGAVIPGATVTITADQTSNISFTQTTNGAGTFSLTVPAKATILGQTQTLTYTITATAPNFAPRTLPGVAVPNTAVSLPLIPSVQTLTGTVKDAQTGIGIAGATVTFTAEQNTVVTSNLTTDASGAFVTTLSSLQVVGTTTSPLTYTVTATASGYAPQTLTGVTLPNTITLTLTPTVQLLTGTVKNAQTGAALIGATVTFTAEQNTAQTSSVATDPNGAFTAVLTSLLISGTTATPVTYTVTASAKGFMSQTVTGVALPNTLNFALAPYHAFPSTLPIQMVSAPYDFTNAGDFGTLFGLNNPPVTGTAAAASWQADLTTYVMYPQAPSDTFHLGRGYFIRFPGPSGLATGTTVMGTGVPAPAGQPFYISLQKGWNMIGDPFLKPVVISSIFVGGLDTAPIGTSRFVALPLYTYTGNAATPYSTLGASDSLQPWVGYWIYANEPVTLGVPAN